MPAPSDDPIAYIKEALKDGTARAVGVRSEALLPAGSGKGPVRLTLPWPPSVNTYYRNVEGKTLISERGREYRKAVLRAVAQSRSLFYWTEGTLLGPLSLEVEFAEPDRRRRDIDNLLKAMLDALQKAGVYDNDSQIRHLEARFARERVPGGSVEVRITKIGGQG